MRIGIITGEYPPLQGGLSDYTDILSRGLLAAGHDVFVFSDQRAQAQSDAIPLENTARRWGIGTMRAIRRWAVGNTLDVVNLQFQTAAYGMSPWVHCLPHLLPVPLVTTFHDLRVPYLFPKAGRLREWIVLHLARASAGAIVTNPEDHQRIRHLPQVRMIPIGSNVQNDLPADFDRNAWRGKAGAGNGDWLLAHFGFINHSKGVDTLLHAVSRLDDAPLKLLMIGGRTGTADPTNQAYAAQIERLIRTLQLESRVRWTGYVQPHEVSAYLMAADALALPYQDGASYRRGSLMAAIEHECAIMTTQPTITTPGFDASALCLVPPNDPAALADAIRRLMDAPAERDRLRQGAKALRQRFQWAQIARDTAEFFEQVIAQQGAA